MYTELELSVLQRITDINKSLEELIESVNKINVVGMYIVAVKEPKKITKEMILTLLQYGIDISNLNKNPKGDLPECFKPIFEKANPKTTITDDHKEDVTQQTNEESLEPDSIRSTRIKKTGNIVHDDLKKRGVIYVRCNKSPEIENRVVDDLIQAADDRDIMIQEFIVNEKDGVNKLKAWVESGVIDYIIMNSIDEYSQNPITRFFFIDEAYQKGIRILLKSNDYNPIFPD